MTADFDQSPSDRPELPEDLRHLGEGPAGDAFRELYAEMAQDFTPDEISEILSEDFAMKQAKDLAEEKAALEADGWTVVSTPASKPVYLDVMELVAHIPSLESRLSASARTIPKKGDRVTVEQPSDSEKEQAAARIERGRGSLRDRLAADEDLVVFIQRPGSLSDLEKLQAAARPLRGKDAAAAIAGARIHGGKARGTLDGIISRTMEKRQGRDGVISQTLEKRIPKEELHTPTPAEFRAEYAGLLSRLQFLEGRDGRTSGQSTQRWLAEYDRMIGAQAAAAPEKTQQAEDIVPVPTELWHAVRNILGLPELDEALVWLAERHEVRPDWYSEDLELALEDLRTFEPLEEPAVNPVYDGRVAVETHTRPSDLPRSNSLRTFLENQLKPSVDAATKATLAEGSRVHDLVEKTYREKGFSGTVVDILFGKLGASESDQPTEESKPEEPRTVRVLSDDFTVQDLIADYDESKLSLVSAYIQTYGHRFSELYSDLAQALDHEAFSDRDRLVMVLGALEAHEQKARYGYHISRIRQILKRR